MKTNNFTNLSVRVSVLAVVAALSGCGGGGSGSTSGPVANTCSNGATDYPICTPAVTPTNLQQSVPASTYVTGTVEQQAFDELNSVRKSLGLGLLAQNDKIDKAAVNHTNYVALNFNSDISAYGHVEVATNQGYTGVTVYDRNIFTGYGNRVSEVLSFNLPLATSLSPIGSLLDTVYHRSNILNQCSRDVGIGYREFIDKNQVTLNPMVIDTGAASGCQTNASDFTFVYPSDKQSGVPLNMFGEAPVPFNDLLKDKFGNNDWINGTSYPISVTSALGTTLTSTTFTITEQGQQTPLDMRIITATNDVNKFALSNDIYAVGRLPFKANTTYNVVFVGAVNGKNFNKTWSFTTRGI